MNDNVIIPYAVKNNGLRWSSDKELILFESRVGIVPTDIVSPRGATDRRLEVTTSGRHYLGADQE